MSSSSTEDAFIASLQWTKGGMSMREFVQDYGYCLPVLFITREGYCGYDEDIHQIGSDEVYWIRGIERQKRIVARREDSANSFISIPVDYPLRVQIINDNNKTGPAISVAEIDARLSVGSEDIKFQFENNQSVSFQVGAASGKSSRFGTMVAEDSYEEKYLLAYTVYGGEIFTTTVEIPVYLDVTVSVAESFAAAQSEDSFNQWMDELKSITATFASTPVRICKEIIIFNQPPPSGDYEYLKPTFVASIQQGSLKPNVTPGTGKDTKINKDTQNEYITQPGRRTKTGVSSSSKKPASTSVQIPLFHQKSKTPTSGGAPTSADDPDELYDTIPDDQGSSSCFFPSGRPPPSRRRPPPAPPKVGAGRGHAEYMTSRVDQKDVSRADQKDVSWLDQRDVSDELRERLQRRQQLQQQNQQQMQQQNQQQLQHQQHQQQATTPPASSFDGFASSDQVPVDFSFDSLTVGDVTKMLRLLKLESYCSIFESRDVDGSLLSALNEEILVQDFGFSNFDARKMIMFTRKGWRPKAT